MNMEFEMEINGVESMVDYKLDKSFEIVVVAYISMEGPDEWHLLETLPKETQDHITNTIWCALEKKWDAELRNHPFAYDFLED